MTEYPIKWKPTGYGYESVTNWALGGHKYYILRNANKWDLYYDNTLRISGVSFLAAKTYAEERIQKWMRK